MTPEERLPDSISTLQEAALINAEKIQDRSVFTVLWSHDMVKKVIPLIQMGLAVYLDKPIVMVVPKGHGTVPQNLRAMAQLYLEVDMTDATALRAATEQIAAFAQQARRERRR